MPATATGVHHRSYRSDLALRHTRAEKARLVLVVAALAALPFLVDVYWLSVVNTILIAVVGAVGLNILVGFTGQISLGQGGFLAVGAFTSALLYERAGMPALVSIAAAILLTAVVGAFFGLPALRLKGLYLAIATLAAQTIILFVVRRWEWLTEGQGYLDVRPFELFGVEFVGAMSEVMWYATLLVIATGAVLAARNLFRTNLGRSFMAVRDHDIAAAAMGVNVTYTKVMAFAVSSGFVGLAGALTAHYNSTVSWERFTLEESILFLAMIIVGGLGSVAGSVYGAAFIILLSPLLLELSRLLHDLVPGLDAQFPALELGAFGLVIVLFLIFEPRGLDRIWQRVKEYVRYWPFRY
ncbi:branched-chain amino acid ABC transporter permease [Lipingzhangella sp. LS1_29]|uniref:Branched-chain amino acid ABC transporter permease n=1 Tax=Lipingzhangella rawalii TaxID=2055835 RepID=A0ABU2H6B3_9ACTN|nr:branched-chain amino acid ABC transporter permease [Lipingzhangella rawalii]MDS1270831.1 branched-chain amino acid ABC transporter permease [Lipingzhangella rawalii]